MAKIEKTFDHVCITCGEKFKSHSKLTQRCKDCISVFQKQYLKMYYHVRIGNMTIDDANKLANKYTLEIVNEKRMIENAKGKTSRCVFCGKTISSVKMFCATCLREGLNNVYIATGRTNGWDRKEASYSANRQTSGWRGRPCGGGNVGVLTNRNFNLRIL